MEASVFNPTHVWQKRAPCFTKTRLEFGKLSSGVY